MFVENFLFSTVGVFFYLYAITSFGLGVTDDSVNYLAAAISSPGPLEKVDGSPFVEWPPLFPLLLSLFKPLKTDLLLFTKVIHGITLFLTIFISCTILSCHIKSGKLSLLSKITIIFSTPLYLVHVFIWSEAVFVLLMLFSVFLLERYLKSGKNYLFFLLILTSVLMSFQRKSGIIIDLGIGLSLLLLLKFSFLKRLVFSFTYILLSVIPFFIYIKNRHSASGRFFTETEADFSRLDNNLSEAMNIITSWLLPDELSLTIRLLFLIMFIILAFTVLYFTRNPQKASPFSLLLFIVLLVYVISLIVGFTYIRLNEPFDDRIFVPIYIPFFILLFQTLDSLYNNISISKANKYLKTVMLTFILLWLFYPIVRTSYHLQKWHNQGIGGYNSLFWRKDKTIAWLQKSPCLPVYTDNPFAVFYYLNVKSNKKVRILQKEELKNSPYLYVCYKNCLNNPGKMVFESESSKIFLKE